MDCKHVVWIPKISRRKAYRCETCGKRLKGWHPWELRAPDPEPVAGDGSVDLPDLPGDDGGVVVDDPGSL